MKRAFAALSMLLALYPLATVAQSKIVTVIVGFAPGGGQDEAGPAAAGLTSRQRARPEPAYDQFAQLIARHFGRFLEGPTGIDIRNMPGSGSRTALKYLAASAPRDGSQLALVGSDALRESVLRNADDGAFPNVVGGFARETYVCVVRSETNVRSVLDAREHELFFGAVDPRSRTFRHANALRLLGARVKLVAGYADIDEAVANLERRELDGLCGWPATSLRAHYADWLAEGRLRALAQFGSDRDPQFAYAPLSEEATTNETIAAMAKLVDDEGLYAWPLVAPSGVEPERLAVLQQAFGKMLREPDVLADATALGLRVDPVGAADMTAAFERLRQAPSGVADLLDRLSKLPPAAR